MSVGGLNGRTANDSQMAIGLNYMICLFVDRVYFNVIGERALQLQKVL